ncbi:MAG TPA: hypothetical protein VMP01_26880 [Pirellulaceae bacterium]|nr:hypothetical protein [Pirellulaceae bacterium]
MRLLHQPWVVGFTLLAIALAFPAQAQPPAKWYKGNLHTHSLWSDGNDFPEMICDWYKTRGYHFLALSDHNILSAGEKWIDESKAQTRDAIGSLARYRERFGDKWVETREKDGKQEIRLKTLAEFHPLFEEQEKFLLIQAEEITDSFQSLPVHVNATNLRDLIKPQRGNSLRETIANNLIAVENQSKAVGQPMLAHLNHPNYGYAVTAEDMAAVLEEKFFEIYNGHPGVNQQGDKQHAGMERMWDIANTLRIVEFQSPPLMGLATDDSHNYFGTRGASPGRGWVMVRAEKLAAEPLIHALEAGDFYASSGIELAVVRFDAEKGRLSLSIVPQKGASYTTEFIGTLKGTPVTSEPIRDDQGQEVRATRRYSDQIGKVLGKVAGIKAAYQLTGDELYVRAVVTSSLAPENPSLENQKAQAWTQPVGWQKHVPAAIKSSPAAAVR